MKYLLLFFSFLLFLQSYAQNKDSIVRGNKKIFVSLYNNQKKKISKGDLLYSSDSTIELMRNSKPDTVPVQKIFYIKTKRSAGHGILVGAAVGTATGIILIAVSSASDGDGGFQGINGGGNSPDLTNVGVAAPFVGIAAGAVAAALRKRETFTINGNVEKWNEVRKKLLGTR